MLNRYFQKTYQINLYFLPLNTFFSSIYMLGHSFFTNALQLFTWNEVVVDIFRKKVGDPFYPT